jgi:hypothetical protein
MKNIILISVLLISVMMVNAQDDSQKTRKERKAEKEAKKAEKIKSLLDDKAFVFNATHVLPMGGGSKYLNYDYDVTIQHDTVVSYLPFYGRAYHVEYGGRNLGFDFTQPLEEYKMEMEDDGYMVEVEVENGMDQIDLTFHISALGYTTLNVTSTNRQAISYYGMIDEIKKEE